MKDFFVEIVKSLKDILKTMFKTKKLNRFKGHP